jgi:hypothetical protein
MPLADQGVVVPKLTLDTSLLQILRFIAVFRSFSVRYGILFVHSWEASGVKRSLFFDLTGNNCQQPPRRGPSFLRKFRYLHYLVSLARRLHNSMNPCANLQQPLNVIVVLGLVSRTNAAAPSTRRPFDWRTYRPYRGTRTLESPQKHYSPWAQTRQDALDWA